MSQGPLRRVLGAGSDANAGPNSSSDQPPQTPGAQAPPSQPSQPIQSTPPENENAEQIGLYTARADMTYVEVPVTVKDTKGNLVPGLTWRDFQGI